MKKVLIISALFLPLASVAEDINGVKIPEWKDFVPPAYINVEAPKGIGKFNETAKYWYKRKVEFEDAILECQSLKVSDAQYSCYQNLKVKQYQKNSDYNARIEAMENARLGPQEMYDRTNNMVPINSYLDNFSRFQPNELRGY